MAISREQFQELRNKGLSVEQIVKFESGKTLKPEQKLNTSQKLSNILLGFGKGVLSTAKGVSELGEKTLGRVVGAYKGGETSASQLIPKNITEATNPYQAVGKFVEQVGEFAVPATKLVKAEKGLSVGAKLISRAVTSGSIASAQEGGVGKGTAIAAGTELLLPGVGKVLKPVTNVISRLFTGLGASLSGASSDVLKTIASNPKAAQEFSKKILAEGQESVLESNAKKILEGVSKIRKEARNVYKSGVESLSKTDIKPDVIYKNTIKTLDNNGIKVLDNGLDFSSSEILDKTIQNRAKNIVSEINNQTTSNGKQLRALIDKLESSKFKSALDPDRKAFNNFLGDLSSGLKKAINESTDKLSEINKGYNIDMDLADGIQKIFGKVKFKNTSELNSIAKKLETLFSQKGLDPKTVDNFLTRININPSEFKTLEAIRNINTKTTGANTKGISFAEVAQQLTSSIITPKMVSNIAIATGISKNAIDTIIKNTSPTARAVIIKSLMKLQ